MQSGSRSLDALPLASEPAPGPQVVVLIVDDDPGVRSSLRGVLSANGNLCLEASTCMGALAAVASGTVGLVLLDVGLGDEDGLDVLRRLRAASQDVPVVVVSGDESVGALARALSEGAHAYLTKPVRAADLRAHVLSALLQHESIRRVQSAHDETRRQLAEVEAMLDRIPRQFTERLVLLSRFRDDETGSHVVRIGKYAEAMSRALRFDEARARLVGLAATMHDIGKIAIPDSILRKPGRLTEEEFRIIKTHTTVGAQMLSGTDVPLLSLASKVALGHHERWDGAGYPDGRRGEETPIEARLVGIVDVYDALSHARVYKPSWPEADVLRHFEEQRGRQFDPSLVDVFLRCLPTLRGIREAIPEEPNRP
jgi:putative two-component system response regulator